MTLTLDDVRNMKFRIARRSGYEVLDVDQFVDRVEEAFAQLTEENEQLKRQVVDLTEAAEASARASEDAPATEQSQEAWQPPAAQESPAAEESAAPVQSASAAEELVVRTADEASPAVVRLVQLATEQAERLVVEAREESTEIVDKANQEAAAITGRARSQAEQLESEARLNSDRLRNEAENRARAFDEELKDRREETFAAMEIERDELRDSVGKLRNFEQTYRRNLTDHLHAQIKGLDSGVFEPGEAPSLLEPADDEDQRGSRRAESGSGAPQQGGASETPRLDALLGGDN